MKIPNHIQDISQKIKEAGYESYLVGGCVRDLLLNKEPNDWDLTTNALPEQILKIFPDAKYENNFGTVLVKAEKELNLPTISSEITIKKTDKTKAITIAKDYINKIICPCHSLEHAETVAKHALEISQEFNTINQDIIEIAAYFHDTGHANASRDAHKLESKKIAQEELSKIFPKNIISIFTQLIHHSEPAKTLEEQILLEADLIDGLGFSRTKKAIAQNLKEHTNWIKKEFNPKGYYQRIKTKTGKKLLQKNIEIFNKSNFDFQVPEFKAKKIAIEVTTYRSEQGYNDHRRPDEIKFETKLDKDLERRDFTVNAMAMDITDNDKIVDLFGGQKDLKLKVIRAVGEPTDRFKEDALRMIRAIRFACQLNYEIEPKTQRAITKLAGSIKFIAFERIGEEFIKIMKSTNPQKGIRLLHDTKLLQYILPELTASCGVAQNHHHKDDVYTHCLLSMHHCPSKNWRVKLAALLHDIGKPKTKKFIKGTATFYNHEYVSERMCRKICKRLKFSLKDSEKICNLVRNHMFYYNTDEVTESSVRRLIKKVGKENLKDLIDLRIGDRLGSGVAKGKPYKLRHLEYVMEKVQNDPISVKMLKINGNNLMQNLKLKPGPKIGTILDVLLSEVIENPKLNTKELLEKRCLELDKLDLTELRAKAKEQIQDKRKQDDTKMKKQHWVK